MTDALKVIPENQKNTTGIKDRKAVADSLTEVLADTYRLIFKTHAYHWNVEGPLFYSVHNLTEEQYNNMFAAADELAERIRALGLLAPHDMMKIMQKSVVQDKEDLPSAGDMCRDLAGDHERIVSRLHDLIELAGDHGDAVTEDLAVVRSAFHEQAVWMLRAISAT